MLDFEREALEAEVLWGDKARTAIGGVREFRVKLHSLIEHYFVEANINDALGLEPPDGPLAPPDAEDDALWKELEQAVAGIEGLLTEE